MKNRCLYPANKQFRHYGGRGISICERWLEPKTGFKNFVADMGERPAGCTLDRINNDGGYEPANCRWATRSQQQQNQSVTRKVTIQGVEFVAADLGRQFGIKTDTIVDRARRGMSLAEVVSKQKHHNLKGLSLGGIANGARQRKKTHCPSGHEYTPENTYLLAGKTRSCRECHRLRELRKRHPEM